MMLEEALCWDDRQDGGQFILVKDCVATSGSFVLNFFLKKLLSAGEKIGKPGPPRVVFLALAAPFSHYSRVCKKQGCNLVAFRDSGDLIFIELFSDGNTWQQPKPQSPAVVVPSSGSVSTADTEDARTHDSIVYKLYQKLREIARAHQSDCGIEGYKGTFIMIDDLSLLEVAAGGSRTDILDFLHYCQVLRFNLKRCSLISLIHQDIYSSTPLLSFLRELEHATDVLIFVEPLSTGFKTDAYGQVTVLNRTIPPLTSTRPREVPGLKMHNLLFRLMENTTQFFAVGHQF